VSVAIDPDKEVLHRVSRPSSFGCPRHPNTVERWIRQGLKSPVTGEIVKLEGFYEGVELHTTREAYLRFLRRLNGQDE